MASRKRNDALEQAVTSRAHAGGAKGVGGESISSNRLCGAGMGIGDNDTGAEMANSKVNISDIGTTNEFAERGATQSGQRFLDSSAPRLIRHAALGKTADGEGRTFPPAGKDEKLSRGLGQSPIGAEGAVPSSLVSQESNRNSGERRRTELQRLVRKAHGLNEQGRKRYCGAMTLEGRSFSGNKTQYHRVDCKCWGCSRCGKKKAVHYRKAIQEAALHYGLSRFLTLTLDPKKIKGDPIRYLRATFNKLRVLLGRRFGRAVKYIAVVELQKNGTPHLHILIDRYIEQAWIQNAWVAVGGGCMVDIRYTDIHRVAGYIAKYLTNELLFSAPTGTRRVTCARAVILFEKLPKTATWQLLKTPIGVLHKRLFVLVVNTVSDKEGELQAFTIQSAYGGAPCLSS